MTLDPGSVGFQFPLGPKPACLVCGDERDIRMGMMRFRQPDENGHHYGAGWRCRDHAACRDRWIEANPGKEFELDESRTPFVFVGEGAE